MNRYIKLYKWLFFLAIIFSILSGFVDVCFTLLLKGIVDRVSNGDINSFVSFGVKSIVVSILMGVVIYEHKVIIANLMKKISIRIKGDIYKAIQSMNITDYRSENTGYFLSILNNDIKIIESDYFGTILTCFYEISIFLTALIATINISLYLAIVLIIISLIPMIIPFLFNRILARSKKSYSDQMAIFIEKAKDILGAFEVVKAFNMKRKIFDEFSMYNKNMEISKFNYIKINSISSSLSTGVMYVTYFLSLLISGYMAINGVITVGSMIASVNLVGSIANPLMAISSNVATIKSSRLIREKILKVVDYSKVDNINKINIDEFNKKIEFKNVSFSYDETHNILNNINLTLVKNKKYAIVGESGSGKSTLVKLLLNYYNTYSGNIYIDNKDVMNIKEEDIFNLMSMIQQDVFIFDDTIRNNVTLFKEYSNEELKCALNKVGLTSVIDLLKDNLETSMGENGANFSGGQKQRIALARAIVKKCPIIILDEATASLDNDTAYKIEKSLLDIQDLTLISITHKLIKENLKMYDEIIYIRSGEIIEKGSFDELMNDKGNFYSLYMLQN